MDYNEIENDQHIKSCLMKNKFIVKKVFDIYKTKVNNLSDLSEIIYIFCDKNFATLSSKVLDQGFKNLLSKFLIKLKTIKKWNDSNIELIIKSFIKEENISFSTFGKPMRFLLTNALDGPSISSIMSILGKKNTIIRINKYISN